MVCGQSVTPMIRYNTMIRDIMIRNDKVRDLSVFVDRELTMEAHVSNTVRGCMYQLRQLRSVKRSLTLDSRGAHLPQHLLLVALTTATVSYTVSRKEKCSDFKWF